nr:reverse transcriptase domain-containing protein [Tanacetum cinerariifolium]
MMMREDENEDELHLNMDLLQERREATAIKEAKYKTKMEQYYNQKERREEPAIREAKYKTKMKQYYNQKVGPTSFKPNEYVFQRNKASRVEDQGKVGPRWEGPYRVTEAYQNGSYKLQTMKGKEMSPRANGQVTYECPERKTSQMSPRANGQVTYECSERKTSRMNAPVEALYDLLLADSRFGRCPAADFVSRSTYRADLDKTGETDTTP